ncbi:hypothetical protein GCM10010269_16450 [Streptomyces humidus]|uniref:Uncharacterized protein n=1 Tax=Streptomyces humidus TaxID=52259 RepID=A0A918FTD9_9ACTN|nr:hypothetical protein [Streptomyces humidus]GGR77967.1 hypothetical protein GCM10010269_16450 [Streptomyces humidus]
MSDTVPETGAEAEAATVPDERGQEQERGQEDERAHEREPVRAHDPAAPAPLAVPRAATGHAEVDACLERLADADHLATDGHVEVYEDVHRGLRDALTALDARPGPPAPAPSPDRRTHSPSYGSRS